MWFFFEVCFLIGSWEMSDFCTVIMAAFIPPLSQRMCCPRFAHDFFETYAEIWKCISGEVKRERISSGGLTQPPAWVQKGLAAERSERGLLLISQVESTVAAVLSR